MWSHCERSEAIALNHPEIATSSQTNLGLLAMTICFCRSLYNIFKLDLIPCCNTLIPAEKGIYFKHIL